MVLTGRQVLSMVLGIEPQEPVPVPVKLALMSVPSWPCQEAAAAAAHAGRRA